MEAEIGDLCQIHICWNYNYVPSSGGKICRNAVAKYLVLASSMGGGGNGFSDVPGSLAKWRPI